MIAKLNEKCKECSAAYIATKWWNGNPIPEKEQFYCCIALMQNDCLPDGQDMNVYDGKKGGVENEG